jgi:hypothetical protein
LSSRARVGEGNEHLVEAENEWRLDLFTWKSPVVACALNNTDQKTVNFSINLTRSWVIHVLPHYLQKSKYFSSVDCTDIYGIGRFKVPEIVITNLKPFQCTFVRFFLYNSGFPCGDRLVSHKKIYRFFKQNLDKFTIRGGQEIIL